MNLKTYTLSVSLAAIIGLIVGVVPLVRSILEYRLPESVAPPPELASLETFVLAKNKRGLPSNERGEYLAEREGMPGRNEWQAMYDVAKTQHIEGIRSKASRDLADGSLDLSPCAFFSLYQPRLTLNTGEPEPH